MSRIARIVAALLVVVPVVACGSSDTPSSARPTTGAKTATTGAGSPAAAATAGTAGVGIIEIVGSSGLRFVPAELTAEVGVRFAGRLVQRGAAPHNIDIPALGVKGDDTTTLESGEAKDFSFTPTKAGRFTFVCTFHPAQMTGTVTVT